MGIDECNIIGVCKLRLQQHEIKELSLSFLCKTFNKGNWTPYNTDKGIIFRVDELSPNTVKEFRVLEFTKSNGTTFTFDGFKKSYCGGHTFHLKLLPCE